MKTIFILAWGKLYQKHLPNLILILFMFTPFTVRGCSLELLKLGEQGIITFCKIPDEKRRQELMAMGIKVGSSIILKQKFPTLQIEVNNINLSIEQDISRAIYVRIVDSQ
jgi:ferrous iron transport protein A